jgi:hypothetical protein
MTSEQGNRLVSHKQSSNDENEGILVNMNSPVINRSETDVSLGTLEQDVGISIVDQREISVSRRESYNAITEPSIRSKTHQETNSSLPLATFLPKRAYDGDPYNVEWFMRLNLMIYFWTIADGLEILVTGFGLTDILATFLTVLFLVPILQLYYTGHLIHRHFLVYFQQQRSKNAKAKVKAEPGLDSIISLTSSPSLVAATSNTTQDPSLSAAPTPASRVKSSSRLFDALFFAVVLYLFVAPVHFNPLAIIVELVITRVF